MTRDEAIQKLWEAATGHWCDPDFPLQEQLFDSSTAYVGLPIKGKELYRIGVALGLIEEAELT